uniref:Uncharacterized protein n=1 Tax=Rhizophora mucronata TaxID=61149 RepID=A0A2P2NWA0_RHIMU
MLISVNLFQSVLKYDSTICV